MGFAEVPEHGCNIQLKKGMTPFCDFAEIIKKNKAYTTETQQNVYYAGFYRNPTDINGYLNGSQFLASLNNEVGIRSKVFQKHRDRFERLHGAMFIMMDKDELMYPAESAIFDQLTPKDKDGK